MNDSLKVIDLANNSDDLALVSGQQAETEATSKLLSSGVVAVIVG